MPIRAFVYEELETLIKNIVPALDKALRTGSLQELRIAGVVTRTAAISQRDLETRYYQARHEVYLAGIGKRDGSGNSDAGAAALEPRNPWTEKSMQVHSRSSVGVFGYPLPAPLVPPQP